MQPLVVNHQSQFPSVTISFNLKPGQSLGTAVTAIDKAQSSLGVPATVSGAFQGTAQAFQSSLASQPYLIAAAMIAVYIILGILYESYILPLTILSTLPSAGVGALLFLLVFKFDLTVIAIVGIILLIGIVKKIRHHDGGFRDPRRAQRGQIARGRHPRSLPAALPPDPDDDDGRVALGAAADAGQRRRVGAAAPARLRAGSASRWSAAWHCRRS